MTRSKSMWLVAFVLVGIAAICLTSGGGEYDWQPAGVGAFAIVAAGGLLFEKRWSGYLAFCVLAAIILIWSYLVYQVSGPEWPYTDALSTALSLLPGAVLMSICVASMIAIYRFFHAVRR